MDCGMRSCAAWVSRGFASRGLMSIENQDRSLVPENVDWKYCKYSYGVDTLIIR